jgi:hypothetical protein
MSFLSLLRNPATLGILNITTLLGVSGGTYLLRSHMKELSEGHEARMVGPNTFVSHLYYPVERCQFQKFLPLLALSHSQCPDFLIPSTRRWLLFGKNYGTGIDCGRDKDLLYLYVINASVLVAFQYVGSCSFRLSVPHSSKTITDRIRMNWKAR